MTVSYYLKRPKGDCLTVVFARIYYGSYEAKWYTDKSIFPMFWNKATKRARETRKYLQYPEFNASLDTIANRIEGTILDFQNKNEGVLPTPEVLKQLLDVGIKKKGVRRAMNFMQFFDDFIQRCKNGTRLHPKTGHPITPGTIKTYETTLECLKNYQKHSNKKVDFDSIDMPFYSDFTKYLTLTVKQSTNYIGKHIKVMKTVLHDATELGLNKNMGYRSKGFTTISEEVDSIYLNKDEIQELKQLDLSKNKRLEATRDLFLVGCFTGLRFSDLSSLTPAQISGDFITITQIKTDKPVVIPVHDAVKEIMAKYNGNLPKAISNQKTNKHLKEICAMNDVPLLKKEVSIASTKAGERNKLVVAKHTQVSTHTARRSFATNEYLAGTPTLTIMAITGHKTEKAFLKYIRVTSDEHAKLLKGIWEKREEV